MAAKSTFSTFNAPDYSSSFSQRPIIIQHVKEVTLHLHDGPTTVRGITLAGGADGFTLNCHTTESRGCESWLLCLSCVVHTRYSYAQ